MKISNFVTYCRVMVLLSFSSAIMGLAGCASAGNKPPSVEEQAAFSGDRNAMPEAEKQRIQQMQQQNGQRAQQQAQQAQQAPAKSK